MEANHTLRNEFSSDLDHRKLKFFPSDPTMVGPWVATRIEFLVPGALTLIAITLGKFKSPTQGLFSLTVKLFISLFLFLVCSFFPKTTKNAFKKGIYKIFFCESLFLRLDKILNFSQNNFSRTSLNFAKSAKINSRKTLIF